MNYRYCILIIIGMTCTVFNGTKAYAQMDYLRYHQGVVQAEKLIVEERYEEAFQVFDSIFEKVDFVFLRDRKVALQLAFFSGDTDGGFSYLKKAIESGWEFKSIRKQQFLKPYLDDPRWKVLEKEYKSLRENYEGRLDQKTRSRVERMYKKDQKMAMGALLRIGDKAQEKYAEKKFAPHSEEQVLKIQNIMKELGYPGEQLIGNDYWTSTILSHHNSISNEYNRKDTLYIQMRPMLKKAISSGKLSPYEFAIIDDWYRAVAFDRNVPGYGFVNHVASSTLTESNDLRQEIGLRTIALRNSLVDAASKTGMDFYLPDWINGKITVEDR